MAGKKGRSGGARRRTRPDQQKRGPLIRSNRDAPFDTERARALKTLILARGWPYTAVSVRRLLSEQIDAVSGTPAEGASHCRESSTAPDCFESGAIVCQRCRQRTTTGA